MKCLKIIVKTGETKGTYFGKILREDNNFIWFKTAKKEYVFGKPFVISIKEMPFEYDEKHGIE